MLILDPSCKDACLMQPKKTKQRKMTHACMQKSLANDKEHKEKTKAENETAVMWPGQAADDWLLCRMVIGRLKNGQRAQTVMRWKQRGGLWVERGRGGDRRTYLAQVIVPPGALLGTETNYTGWTYHRRPVPHFGLNTAVFLELNQIVERIPRTSARTQRNTPSSQ